MYQLLVYGKQYLYGKEKIDSRFRGNDIWRGGNDRSLSGGGKKRGERREREREEERGEKRMKDIKEVPQKVLYVRLKGIPEGGLKAL